MYSATSDLGIALASQYYSNGHNVVLVSKKKEKLFRLQRALMAQGRQLKKRASAPDEPSSTSIPSDSVSGQDTTSPRRGQDKRDKVDNSQNTDSPSSAEKEGELFRFGESPFTGIHRVMHRVANTITIGRRAVRQSITKLKQSDRYHTLVNTVNRVFDSDSDKLVSLNLDLYQDADISDDSGEQEDDTDEAGNIWRHSDEEGSNRMKSIHFTSEDDVPTSLVYQGDEQVESHDGGEEHVNSIRERKGSETQSTAAQFIARRQRWSKDPEAAALELVPITTAPNEANTHSSDGAAAGIILVATDLRNPVNVINLASELESRNIKIDVLVNHAANEGSDTEKFHKYSWGKMRSMVDSNIQSSVMLTRLLLPRMIDRFTSEGRSSRVVFVSSLASVTPTADVALFAASQSFITAFAKSLRRECVSSGVAVTCALPNSIRNTNSHIQSKESGTIESSKVRQSNLRYQLFGTDLSSEAIARDIFYASKHGRNYVIPGWANKLYTHVFANLLPEATLSTFSRLCWQPLPRWLAALRPPTATLPAPVTLSRTRKPRKPNTRQRPLPAQKESQLSKGATFSAPTGTTTKSSMPMNATTTGDDNTPVNMNFTTVKVNVRDWLAQRWEQPLIDYVKIRQWVEDVKVTVTHPEQWFRGILRRYGSGEESTDEESASYAESDDESWQEQQATESESYDDLTSPDDDNEGYQSDLSDSSDQITDSNTAYEERIRSGNVRRRNDDDQHSQQDRDDASGQSQSGPADQSDDRGDRKDRNSGTMSPPDAPPTTPIEPDTNPDDDLASVDSSAGSAARDPDSDPNNGNRNKKAKRPQRWGRHRNRKQKQKQEPDEQPDSQNPPQMEVGEDEFDFDQNQPRDTISFVFPSDHYTV